MSCVACRKDAPTLTAVEIDELHPQVPDWDIVEIDGIKRLRRVFSVDDFAQALEFTNSVARLAEEEEHHPALLTEWGRTTVTWWTHKIKGLHRNDFIMAAKNGRLSRAEPTGVFRRSAQQTSCDALRRGRALRLLRRRPLRR
jgi:4a-hydroxytetrahydrobiopterin dehydratase